MAILKQAVFAVLILAGAAFAWLKLYPGAVDTLVRYGLDYPVITALASTPEAAAPAEGGRRGGRGMGREQVVATIPAIDAFVNNRLNAIGDGEAVKSVNVTPYVTGNIAEVTVESGDEVEAGQLIARLSSEEQRIAVDRARLGLQDAQTTLDRYNTLRASSASSIANVEITTAELAVQTAQLELQEAELNLERRSITAPIGGVIGIVAINPGDYVTTDTEIVTIDDRSQVLVDFWVPERFASAMRVGMTIEATAIARPGEIYEGELSAIDNRIDQASRTLQVRATIPNDNDELRAGMSFSVQMTFDGDEFPAVDPLAIQWSNEGSYVWRVDDGKAERVAARIVQRNSDSVLVDAEIAAGDPIITEGLMQLREGAAVTVVASGTGGGAVETEASVVPVAENTIVPARPARLRRPSGS